MDKYKNISQSAKLDAQYDDVLQEVKKHFRVKHASDIKISQSKASRVLSGKQKDLSVLSEMASYVGIEINLIIEK